MPNTPIIIKLSDEEINKIISDPDFKEKLKHNIESELNDEIYNKMYGTSINIIDDISINGSSITFKLSDNALRLIENNDLSTDENKQNIDYLVEIFLRYFTILFTVHKIKFIKNNPRDGLDEWQIQDPMFSAVYNEKLKSIIISKQ